MKSIHAPSGASFLQELKSAQDFIDKAKSNDWDTPNGFLKLEGKYWAIDISSMDEDHIRNVLRRIPQLIETIDMIEGYANLGKTDIVLDNKYVQRQHFAVDILTKLEGKKDE